MKLGHQRNYHKGRAAIRHYANQPACLLWPLLLVGPFSVIVNSSRTFISSSRYALQISTSRHWLPCAGHTSGISLQFRSGSLRSLSRESRDSAGAGGGGGGGGGGERPCVRRRSFLNTSYSSEELVGNGSAGRSRRAAEMRSSRSQHTAALSHSNLWMKPPSGNFSDVSHLHPVSAPYLAQIAETEIILEDRANYAANRDEIFCILQFLQCLANTLAALGPIKMQPRQGTKEKRNNYCFPRAVLQSRSWLVTKDRAEWWRDADRENNFLCKLSIVRWCVKDVMQRSGISTGAKSARQNCINIICYHLPHCSQLLFENNEMFGKKLKTTLIHNYWCIGGIHTNCFMTIFSDYNLEKSLHNY